MAGGCLQQAANRSDPSASLHPSRRVHAVPSADTLPRVPQQSSGKSSVWLTKPETWEAELIRPHRFQLRQG